MMGNWWEAEDMTPPIRDQLLGIFMENSSRIFFSMHGPTLSARLSSPDPQTQPHRALLEPMYLLACYFSSHPSASSSTKGPPSSSLAVHEAHFLDRARRALQESLSYSDRLLDFLRGSVLVTTYLFLRGRFIEGFAVSCGLNHITSHVFRVDGDAQPTSPSGSSFLLGPPVSQIDVGERISTFWNIFVWDKVASIFTGFLSAMPSEGNFMDTIDTVFPRTLEQYATGGVTDQDNESIRDLLEPHQAPFAPSGTEDAPYGMNITNLKALILLERAMRLAGNYRARPSNDTCKAIQKHLAATLRFASTLVEDSTPLLIGFTPEMEWSNQTANRYMSSVMTLGALMEMYNTQADVDPVYYDARLARARELAGIASQIPPTAYLDYPFSSIGYCGCFAAQIILDHVQQLQGRDPQAPGAAQETSDCEESLAHLLEALSRVDATNPGFTPFGLASALLRWDAFHFSSIALRGYKHEQQFAFLPGLPLISRLLGEVGLYVARRMGLSDRGSVNESDVLIGGATAVFLLCDWTGDMYDLTMTVTGNSSASFLATLLTLVPLSPPALLFAGYNEPFFAMLSYKGMLACERKRWPKATACFMVATAFRANGIMLAGFLVWGIVLFPVIKGLADSRKMPLLLAVNLSAIVALPLAAHQYFAYTQFCNTSTPSFDGTLRPWCLDRLPLIYPFVQRQYWNVGLFRYWTISQIPNFILAAPALVLLLSSSIGEIRAAVRSIYAEWQRTGNWRSALRNSMVLIKTDKPSSSERPHILRQTWRTLPHAAHALILSLILLFASHVQIILRLSSSIPYLYWAAARLIVADSQREEAREKGVKWGRIWVWYAVIWGTISCVLWATFLPPA
ncbi:ER membrane glycoprotein subunit of the GPI transamidase complex-like protein [Tulasnella sp. 330]|nr:ER membrane glycoprotein subunit of the GPI transamidase complex-like protein [Tulasnella sp. 330]